MDLSLARARRYGRAGVRWGRLLVPGKPAAGVRVFYGHDRVPASGERAAGGTAKAQKLNERFPNRPTDFSVLYLGTTWLPRDLGPLLSLARRRRIPIVVNQDGVGYPGFAGERTEERNRPLRQAVLAATTCSTRASSRSTLRISSWVSHGILGGASERRRREPVQAGNSVASRLARCSC